MVEVIGYDKFSRYKHNLRHRVATAQRRVVELNRVCDTLFIQAGERQAQADHLNAKLDDLEKLCDKLFEELDTMAVSFTEK